MPLLSQTPSSIQITPRNRQYEIEDSLGRDWFDGHPFKTAWFNAMSLTFPQGEKFFIDSVRHFSDHIEDDKLNSDVRGFCGQEGFHRREHQRYNEVLCEKRGYDLQKVEARLEKNIQMSYSHFSAIQRLALTAAFEHITAILAESALDADNPMINAGDPAMMELWNWHAAEEMEHKAVAFDVYRAVGGSEKMRKRAMFGATLFLLIDVMYGLAHMLRRDKKFWSLRVWSEGFAFLFSKKEGVLRRVWPAYKEYYRMGFHPWQRDTRDLLDTWSKTQEACIAAELAAELAA